MRANQFLLQRTDPLGRSLIGQDSLSVHSVGPWTLTQRTLQIVPLEPELSMSIFAYGPFGTGICAKWVISKNGHRQFWLQGGELS